MTAAIFAILVGLAGAYMVRQYLSRPEAAAVAQQAPEMITVPVAGVDLMAGRNLTINDIAIHRMTRDEFAKSPYANEEFMTDSRQIAGRMLKSALKKGDAFLTTSLYPEGMGPGVAELLKPGQRAVTVAIENVGAVEGFARPGTLVDVLYRSTATDNVPEVTMTLLDRVEVLAVGKISVPGHDVSVGATDQAGRGTVTLAVNPDQAKALKVVEGRGELTLSLRNPEDAATLSSLGYEHHKVTLYQVLGLPEPKGPKSMDIYLGGVKSTVTFGGPAVTTNQIPAADNIRTPIAADDPRTIRSTSPVAKSKFSTTAAVRPNGT
jgi:pilus assembly protein CpaB